MTETVSVFGGHGFVGGEVVRLLGKRAEVHARDDYVPSHAKILYFISTVHNYNIYDDPYLDIETNLITLIRVLENARLKFGSDFEFYFISSWFVYGDIGGVAQENDHCDPKGFYSITKRTAEQLLQSYCETYKIKYRIMRLPNVLGVGDSKVSAQKNALQWLIQQMLLDNDIDLYYGGQFYRDYMDVRDVARAIVLVMDKGTYNIYNIALNSNHLFRTLFDYCYDATGSSSNVEFLDQVEFHSVVQTKSVSLSDKRLSELGFEKKYRITDTLDEIIKAYKNELLG